jgi:hypothetical protein
VKQVGGSHCEGGQPETVQLGERHFGVHMAGQTGLSHIRVQFGACAKAQEMKNKSKRTIIRLGTRLGTNLISGFLPNFFQFLINSVIESVSVCVL